MKWERRRSGRNAVQLCTSDLRALLILWTAVREEDE